MKEWLPRLNVRRKWTDKNRDLEVGDLALVISPDQLRGHRPSG